MLNASNLRPECRFAQDFLVFGRPKIERMPAFKDFLAQAIIPPPSRVIHMSFNLKSFSGRSGWDRDFASLSISGRVRSDEVVVAS